MSTTPAAAAPYADAAHPPHRPVPWWGWVLAAALLLVAGVGGAAFAPPGTGVAVWWPAAGIALGFAMLQPAGRIPLALALALVATAAANAIGGRPLPLAIAFGVADTIGTAAALGVLQPWRHTFRLSSLRAALRFASATAVSAVVGGALIGAARALVGDGELWPTAPFVAASHAAAMLTIAPFAALPPRIPVRAGVLEMSVQASLLALALAVVFHPEVSLPLAFTLYPFLAWAAFRFPIRLVLLETLVASLAMLVLTLAGGGPFSGEAIGIVEGAALLEVLLVSFAGFGVVLCAAQYELRALSRRLDASTLLLSGSLVDARIGLAIAVRRADETQVVWTNRAARSLLDAELGHRDVWAGRIEAAAVQALHSAEQTSVTTVGGRSITVAANAIEGDEDRFAVQLLDVTSILQAQQTQVEAEVERESARSIRAELERQRDDFLATTSHELRTPITSIVGYTELLADSEAVAPAKRGWLDVIDRNAHRLAELVEDLLTLSGGATAPTRPQHLDELSGAAVLEEVVANLRVVSDPKGIEVSIAPGDVLVLGARGDVLRAITNLLMNAIKFTPEGGRIRLAASEDDGMALLVVADTGPGMTDEELAQAFERFYRAPGAERANVAGTGLGLAIVAELARRNGGDVELARNDDGGLTAELRLPLPA